MTLKRIGIVALYDEDGIVDDYRMHLIKEIRNVVSRLIIVVNGTLNQESITNIKGYTQEIIWREDKGYDCTAIKDVLIAYVKWEQLQNYDELVWSNDSFFGPFVHLYEIVENMQSCCCDFWGLTEQTPVVNTFSRAKYSEKYLPRHVQPYFLCVRKRLLQSNDFKVFWETMPVVNDYEDAVIHYELRLTQFFINRGYWGAAYVKNTFADDEHPDKNDIWIMNHSFSMLSLNNLPVVKKKCFTRNHNDLLGFSVAEDAYLLLDYINNNTKYDVDFIWRYLIRVMNPAELNRALSLRYILPVSESNRRRLKKREAAVIAHINYDDLVEDCFEYLRNIPKEIDIYINTKKESTKEKIYQCIHFYNMENCQIVMIGDRGREIRGMLIESKEIFRKYEYVCFVHDKKTTGNLTNPLLGKKFMELLWENTLKSEDYIYNCISLFEQNKHIGLLVPPPPYHDNNLGGVGSYWTSNYYQTQSLAKRLNLTCKISENFSPLTLGTTFWCRTSAMCPLYEYCFKEEDFPKEPMSMDGTLNHAIERIFSFVAQSQGYATGIIMNDKFATLHLENYEKILHSFLLEMTNGNVGISLNEVFHIPNDLWSLIQTRKKLFVYGDGINAEIMIRILEQMDVSIEGCIVSDHYKNKNWFSGYKVYELSQLDFDSETMGIVIAVRNNRTIIENLNKRGIYAYCLMQGIGN